MRLFNKSYLKLYVAAAILASLGAAAVICGPQKLSIESVVPTAAAQTAVSGVTPTTNAGAAVAPNPKNPPAPNCQPGVHNLPPTPIAVAAQPGLHSSVLGPGSYTVYGNTSDEINNQIARCTPVNDDDGSFAASTDYALNWAFDFQAGSDGLCHVTAASVAINISVIYPSWQQTPGAAAGLSKSWQQFATNLATHENGHVKIDRAGAAQLLSSLQNFPASSCDTIVAQVTAKANHDIQAMDQANEAYDAATNHGASQGAVLN